MSAWNLVFLFGLIGVLLMVLVVGLVLAAPVVSGIQERHRMDREVQEASWRIHQQATKAFGRLLEAARQDQEGDR